MNIEGEFKFEPLEEFNWHHEDDNRLMGCYFPGNSYNCTKHVRHDSLRKKCAEWASENKIRIIPLASGQVFRDIAPGEK